MHKTTLLKCPSEIWIPTDEKKTFTKRIHDLFIKEASKPSAKSLWMLSAVEVMALVHGEEGLELYPFHLYTGKVKGTVECKHKVPLMEKLVSIKRKERLHRENEKILYKPIIDKIYERWYILPEELRRLKKSFVVITEKEPSLFIVAPKAQKSQAKEHVSPVQKDPILLVKYGENAYLPLHSRDHSAVLDAKLSRLS